MNDDDFLQQFENQTLDEEYFNHQGHLRLAWLYLSENNLDDSIDLICSGIKSYAESLGATTKFHLTITVAIVRIMHKRMLIEKTESWQSFLQNNPDMHTDLLSILYHHYSPELITSDIARTTLVETDLNPL